MMLCNRWEAEPRFRALSVEGRRSSAKMMFEPSSVRAESPIVFAERNLASLLAVPGPTVALDPAGPVEPVAAPAARARATAPGARPRTWRRLILFSFWSWLWLCSDYLPAVDERDEEEEDVHQDQVALGGRGEDEAAGRDRPGVLGDVFEGAGEDEDGEEKAGDADYSRDEGFPVDEEESEGPEYEDDDEAEG